MNDILNFGGEENHIHNVNIGIILKDNKRVLERENNAQFKEGVESEEQAFDIVGFRGFVLSDLKRTQVTNYYSLLQTFAFNIIFYYFGDRGRDFEEQYNLIYENHKQSMSSDFLVLLNHKEVTLSIHKIVDDEGSV